MDWRSAFAGAAVLIAAVACGDQQSTPSPTPTLAGTIASQGTIVPEVLPPTSTEAVLATPRVVVTPTSTPALADAQTATPTPTALVTPTLATTSVGATTPTPVSQALGTLQVRVTDAPLDGLFSLQVELRAIEVHRAEDQVWIMVVPGPVVLDLVALTGV